MKQILVTIDALGNPNLDAKGFTGGACKVATKPLEDVFSGGSSNTVEKPEMKQSAFVVAQGTKTQQVGSR